MFVLPSEAENPDCAAFWAALRAGTHQAGDYCRVGKGGREVWIRASYTPILDPAGRGSAHRIREPRL